MSEEKKQTESYPPICPECGCPEPTVGLCTCMNEDTYSYDDPADCWAEDYDNEYPDDYDDCNYREDDQEDSR